MRKKVSHQRMNISIESDTFHYAVDVMKNKYPVLKAIFLFLPEIVICFFILTYSESLKTFMFSIAKHIFVLCLHCLDSTQFLLSSSLFIFCLFSHLMRFLVFHLIGNPLLINHKPSKKELAVSVLCFGTYCILLINSLNNTFTIKQISISIIDIIGISVSSLALIEISIPVFSIFFITKEN